MDNNLAYKQLTAKLSDRYWRLNNLYYIRDADGNKVLFKFNWMQEELYRNLWHFNVILKARQLGCTTFTLLYFLDSCLFNSNHAAGIIAHTQYDAENLFKNKVKFAYDNLPEWLKKERPTKSASASTLTFSNDSYITVGLSLRSGTFQKVLVSEYGKISARDPMKAVEIKTGALNTVPVEGQIIIESTAEGKTGEFYNMVERARELELLGRPLTRKQPRFHFFPWFKNDNYQLSPQETERTAIPTELREYLDGLGVSKEQAAWYAETLRIQADKMKQEHPSTPDEAFEAQLHGAYYLGEMRALRKNKQIGGFKYDPSHSVYTAWDLGLNDQMVIWFFQMINGVPRFIDYHESMDEGWNYYAQLLQGKGYTYQRHFFPHDGNKRVRGGEVITDREQALNVGIRPIDVIPRTTSVMIDIRNYCKPALLQSMFDEENCSLGIDRLDSYRKKWNRATAQYEDSPHHDEASHGADAFRTFAVAFKTGKLGDRYAEVKSVPSGTTTIQRVNSISRGLRARNL
jgi:hypothetical protein